MNRLLFSCLALVALQGSPLSPDEREASVRYVNDLQNSDGGFRPGGSERSSQLAATTSALRALKYLGGVPRNRSGPVEFVQSCYDSSSGGLSDSPGARPDVRSTAMGLMAMAELKMPLGERAGAIRSYFDKNAQSLPDYYIAAAALHSASLTAPRAEQWIAAYEATRRPDGSYGQGAIDTASAVNTILRLGGALKDRDAAARVLRAAQGADGGFSATGGNSDLAATYRIMRALHMLEARPDLDRCRQFIARCRNSDGGYGASPGQPSSTSATYFAAIVLHWIEELGKN